MGPVRFSASRRGRTEERTFEQRLIVRETEFDAGRLGPDPGIQEIYAALATDENRNTLIFDDVLKALEEGRSPVLLTERKDHLDLLAERKFTRHLVVLKGGMTTTERNKAMEHLDSIPASEERLVLATGRYIGEGFDDARLDTLFLTLPVAWKGTLVQYAGRLHRQRPDKREVRIYDYVDRNVPALARMFEKRVKGYRALGYREAPSGTASQHGVSLPSGCFTLPESIRAAGEIPFEVDIIEKDLPPTGAKGRRKTY